MNLSELLTANPAAKAEFDAKIAEARQAGEKAMQETINQVAPFLASKDYPSQVSALAVKVAKGEEPMSSLTTVVCTIDAMREEQATAAATAAAKPDTTGQQHETVDPAAVVADETGLDAAIARAKGGAV